MSDLSKISFGGTEYNVKDTTARAESAKKVTAAGGDISNTKIATADNITTAYPIPAAGDTAKGFLGKMKKFCEDIRNTTTGACFIGQIVNNCVTNNAKLPLSAAQGKVLMDLVTQLNADFASTIFKKDGLAALQSNSRMGSTRLQIMDDKDYVEIFRSTDSWTTYRSMGILATKDDLYARTSIDISNMTLAAVYALPPGWSTTIPVFVNYNSALAPDHNTCTGFISKNYVRLFSVSGKNFRAVSGQTDGFVEC